MKLLTRKEKMDKTLMDRYNKHIADGMKPERAVDLARQEAKECGK